MHGVNESRVKLWIEALRSGEFVQAKNYLETDADADTRDLHAAGADGSSSVSQDGTKKAHCCLGVAMKVALRNGWEPKNSPYWGATSMDAFAADWFGFTHADPDLGLFQIPDGESQWGGSYTARVTCVYANDDLGWDFERIARALEDRYITPESIEGGS